MDVDVLYVIPGVISNLCEKSVELFRNADYITKRKHFHHVILIYTKRLLSVFSVYIQPSD